MEHNLSKTMAGWLAHPQYIMMVIGNESRSSLSLHIYSVVRRQVHIRQATRTNFPIYVLHPQFIHKYFHRDIIHSSYINICTRIYFSHTRTVHIQKSRFQSFNTQRHCTYKIGCGMTAHLRRYISYIYVSRYVCMFVRNKRI